MNSIFPPGLILILPSRLAVARERRRLLSETTGGTVLGPRIITMGQLEAWLDRETNKQKASTLAREFILGTLIEPELLGLGWPKASLGSSGPAKIGVLIDQLKTGGVTPQAFTEVAGDLDSDRIVALARIYDRYERAMADRGLADRAMVRRLILQNLNQGQRPRCLEDVVEIVIRDFSRLTIFQTELVKGLSRIGINLKVHLACPDWTFDLELPGDFEQTNNPFVETIRTIKAFEQSGESGLELVLALSRDEGSRKIPALKVLERLFSPSPIPASGPPPVGAMEIWSTPGRYAEVEEIGRRIVALIDQGVAPEEIVVVVRDLGAYGQIVEDVFRRFKLPLFFRRGAPVEIQAPTRALLSLLRLARSNWTRPQVLDILASPYLQCGLNIDWTQAARLSAKAGVTDERAGGGWHLNMERLARRDTREKEAVFNLLEVVDRLKEKTAPLARDMTWADFVKAAIDLLGEFGLEQSIKRGSWDHVRRDAGAWTELRSCLDELAEGAGQAGIGQKLFAPEILSRSLVQALKGRNIGQQSYPSSGIMVLNAFDLHGLSFDHVFVAGLNEGEFPSTRNSAVFLHDDEVSACNQKLGQRVFLSTASEYRQEELLFYFTLAAADRQVVLTYNRSDHEGRIQLPSALIDEVMRLWPPGVVSIQDLASRIVPDISKVLTREEMLGVLAGRLINRQALGGAEARQVQEACMLLCLRPREHQRWQSLVRRAAIEESRFDGLIGPYFGMIKPDWGAAWLTGLPRHQGWPLISPTMLEMYGQCPFAFWAGQILGLSAVEDPLDELSPMQEGVLLHEILKNYLSSCQKRGLLPLAGKAGEIELLKKVSGEVLDNAEKRIPLGRRPLWQIRRLGIWRMLSNWLQAEQDRDDDYQPAFLEWSFGPETKTGPLDIPFSEGGGLCFRGRIDRIDESPDQFLVIDYKNSSNRNKYQNLLKSETLGQTSFQAPLYQIAVARLLGKPAQSAWILLRDFSRGKLRTTPSTADPVFDQNPEQRRLAAAEEIPNFYNNLEATWGRLISGNFVPDFDQGECEYCQFKTVCRGAMLDAAV